MTMTLTEELRFTVGQTYSETLVRSGCGYGIVGMEKTPIGDSREFQAYGLGQPVKNHCWRYDRFTMKRVSESEWLVESFDGSRFPR